MNEYNNEFHIGGQGNIVHIHQEFTDGGNEALAQVLKFLLTLLLSPVLIPLVLTLNGYKMMTGNGQDLLGGNDDDE